MTRVRLAVIRALKADEVFNNARGWTINLSIFRIVILSFGVLPCALLFLDWTEKILLGISREMWVPISFYRLLPVGFLANVGVARGLAVADIVLIVFGIVGFWTRSSIGFATLISLYGFGLMQNLAKVNHESYHLIWFMALLAAGPSGHFLSIDAVRRAIRNADEGVIEKSFSSPSALWTLRYTWLLVGALYLVTGSAKLQSTLTEHWVGAANLRNILWAKWLQLYWYDPHFMKPIRVDLLPDTILVLLGASVVAFEIGFILLVFFRRLRSALGVWGLAFHVGNGLVLKIWFNTLIPAYVSLFDWTAMGRVLSRPGRDILLVFYDEGCGLCRRTVAILRSFDLFDVLKPVAGISNDPVRGSYPQITDEMLARGVCAAAGGRIAVGYDAYAWIAKRLFLLWPIAAIMDLPFVAALGRKVYRRVADSRHCTLAPLESKERAASHHPELAHIHRLGLTLLACQLSVSGFMLLYNLRDIYLPANVPRVRTARWLVNGIEKRQPEWPFDLYPTFTPVAPSAINIWEARWVTSSGREMRISPTAYDHAFGNPSLAETITTRMLAEEDSERGQAGSLDLVRLLWRSEIPDIRQSVTAVIIYRTEYTLHSSDNAPAALVRESLLHTFPLKLFSEERTSPFASTNRNWPR